MAKKDFLECAITHFQHQETRLIYVPELNLVCEDAIYVKPFTLIEKDEIFKGTSDNSLTVLIDVIVKKALTKDGEKMLDLETKINMKRIVEPDILNKNDTDMLVKHKHTNTLIKTEINIKRKE